MLAPLNTYICQFQQQREHMYLRARQEPEVAILDRHGPQPAYLASKPPPGPPGYRPSNEVGTIPHPQVGYSPFSTYQWIMGVF